MNSTVSLHLADEKLIELVQQDDHRAFEVIYDRYSSRLYYSAFHLLRDTQVCEDLVQELFIHLWIKRHSLKILSLRSYLYRSIQNKVLMYLRNGRAHLDMAVAEELQLQYGSDSKLLENEVERALDEGIGKLPEKCRQIFYLSRKEQLSNKEISGLLNISTKTVENQITIALRRLRVTLDELLTVAVLCMAVALM